MLALKMDTSDLDRKFKMLLEMPKTIEKAVVGAMADTVDDVHRAQITEMGPSFKKVSPYVKKGLIKALPYGKDRQFGGKRLGQSLANSGTYFEDFPSRGSPNSIIAPNVFGGTRREKASESRLRMQGLIMPAGFAIQGDDYPRGSSGNINGARYSEMLAAIGALSDTARSQMPKGKQRNRKGVSFFAMVPKGGRKGDMPMAIAERRGGDLKIMLVPARKVGYTKKYDYYGVGRKQLNYSLPRHFDRILKRYLDRV
jgi:hypothetical protein